MFLHQPWQDRMEGLNEQAVSHMLTTASSASVCIYELLFCHQRSLV
uniref:Uncharacterized protein n=1 Tax=Arundo donax TaxID=35708 RepID=A0A0A9I3D6_ARUDO